VQAVLAHGRDDERVHDAEAASGDQHCVENVIGANDVEVAGTSESSLTIESSQESVVGQSGVEK
jgi:hypothetical protein